MTAREKWGYQYVYHDGTVADAEVPGRKYALCSFYTENDGWSFMNRGPEREMQIFFDPSLDCASLEKIVASAKGINQDAKGLVDKMVKERKIRAGSYDVE